MMNNLRKRILALRFDYPASERDGMHAHFYDAAIDDVLAILDSQQAAPAPGEICLCAALLMEDGYIFRGHRHDDCYLTMGGCKRYTKADGHKAKQGFLTSQGRFVSRAEAAAMYPEKDTTLLFSEDLY